MGVAALKGDEVYHPASKLVSFLPGGEGVCCSRNPKRHCICTVGVERRLSYPRRELAVFRTPVRPSNRRCEIFACCRWLENSCSMNSLNILSTRVSPMTSAGPSRSKSLSRLNLAVASQDVGCFDQLLVQEQDEKLDGPLEIFELRDPSPKSTRSMNDDGVASSSYQEGRAPRLVSIGEPFTNEETSLLGSKMSSSSRPKSWTRVLKMMTSRVLGSIRWLFLKLLCPGGYLLSRVYKSSKMSKPTTTSPDSEHIYRHCDNKGQNKKSLFWSTSSNHARIPPATSFDHQGVESTDENIQSFPTPSLSSSAITSESESDSTPPQATQINNRSTSSVTDSTSRGSIRIQLSDNGPPRQHKVRRRRDSSKESNHDIFYDVPTSGTSDLFVHLKSPTSPSGSLTKYPKAPAPPRPLVPRRQPSYLNIELGDQRPQKTLVLDLDETLIHSISKGGRMSTGHMVEAKLNTTYVDNGGHYSLGPQHPILYWVNKRPHCDEFLRRVYKWYNLIVFTASVPEYADPVIDWLEQEKKFFSRRYYRQHCTLRDGAFIKDLSSIEPDLSKVIILDNSPLSYMYHRDNAIPIQGWINDPTDNDLLHLVPLLEALQYVSDVRSLLALKGGEDGWNMT